MRTINLTLIVLMLNLVSSRAIATSCNESCVESNDQGCAHLMVQEQANGPWGEACSAPVGSDGSYAFSDADGKLESDLIKVQESGGAIAIFTSGGKNLGFKPRKKLMSLDEVRKPDAIDMDQKTTIEAVRNSNLGEGFSAKAKFLEAKLAEMQSMLEGQMALGLLSGSQAQSVQIAIAQVKGVVGQLYQMVNDPSSVSPDQFDALLVAYDGDARANSQGRGQDQLFLNGREGVSAARKLEPDFQKIISDLYLQAFENGSVDFLFRALEVLGDAAKSIDSDELMKFRENLRSQLKFSIEILERSKIEVVPMNLDSAVLGSFQELFLALVESTREPGVMQNALERIRKRLSLQCEEMKAGMIPSDGTSCALMEVADRLHAQFYERGENPRFSELKLSDQQRFDLVLRGVFSDPTLHLIQSEMNKENSAKIIPELQSLLVKAIRNAESEYLMSGEFRELIKQYDEVINVRVRILIESPNELLNGKIEDPAAPILEKMREVWSAFLKKAIQREGNDRLFEYVLQFGVPKVPGIAEFEEASENGVQLEVVLAFRSAEMTLRERFFETPEAGDVLRVLRESSNRYSGLIAASKAGREIDQNELLQAREQMSSVREKLEVFWRGYVEKFERERLMESGKAFSVDSVEAIDEYRLHRGPPALPPLDELLVLTPSSEAKGAAGGAAASAATEETLALSVWL